MSAKIRILGMRQKADFDDQVVVNACSNSASDWARDLSPFLLGPCPLYGGMVSKTMENAWQYSKLYAEHTESLDGKASHTPSQKYWDWAKEGWDNPRAVRYPMGKGAKPCASLWDGALYSYISARKHIYGPLYRDAVIKTAGFAQLKKLYEEHAGTLVIRDFDGYDYEILHMSLTDVLNLERRKMGHAFVLAMMLTNDPALKELRQ